MNKNTVENRKKLNAAKSRAARRAAIKRRRRRKRIIRCACIIFVLLCICAAVVLVKFGQQGLEKGSDAYTEGGNIDVAAVPAMATPTLVLVPTVTEDPFSAATQMPEESAAPVATEPVPTVEPAAAVETPEPDGAVSIVISAAGDCTLGGDYGNKTSKRFAACYESEGADYFFESVRPIFTADDFTVVNLEGPLTTQTSKRANRTFNFQGNPKYTNILSNSSVEVCTLANNHAYDFKTAGLLDTVEAVQGAGMGAAGYDNAYYTEKDGVRLCFLSFTEWDYTKGQIAERLELERENCDILIVSIHWGEELRNKPTNTQKNYGHAIIDAGADLVLGHHSHVVGTLEKYNGKYIVYGLGNFCFGGNTNPRDKDTMIFQQTFIVDAQKALVDGGINIIPCSISSSSSTNDYQPTPLKGDEAQRVIKKIASYSSLSMSDIQWMDSFMENT